MSSLVDEIASAENGISSATAVVTDVDDYEHYNITIDRMALSADDSVHVDGWVSLERFQFELTSTVVQLPIDLARQEIDEVKKSRQIFFGGQKKMISSKLCVYCTTVFH